AADRVGLALGAAALGVLERLEYYDACALAHHEAVALLVPRTRGLGRIVVEGGGERAGRRETRNADSADRSLGAARDHHVSIVPHDDPRGVADRVSTARARRHHRVVGT